MDLILTVVRYQSQPSQQTLTARIGIAGGTIGRNPDNDLVLSDPDRWVGRQHATIAFRDGSFYLADTSKNGTFVNSAPEPLHEGQEIELRDGDVLSIGAYEVGITLEVEQPPRDKPHGPFAGGIPDGELLGPTPSGQAAPDILELVAGSPTGHEPSPFLAPEPRPPMGPDDIPPPAPPQTALWSLGTEREPPKAPTAATESDHIRDENAFYSPPAAIPEDYDILADEPRPRSGGLQAQAEEPAPSRTPPPPGAPSIAEQQAPSNEPVALKAETGPPPDATGETPALQAFLAGLGTGKLPDDPQARARLMQMAGLLLRAMTEGLMQVLMGRTKFKSELRLEMTAIRSVKNNPLKFSVDPEDALAHLLFRPSRGYLPAIEAAREAFDDIHCHELALMAGLGAALRAQLALLDPAELERKSYAHSVMDNLMPMARKSKHWDLFTATYDEISADMAEDVLRRFKGAFTRAYEDQALRIRQTKRDAQPPNEG